VQKRQLKPQGTSREEKHPVKRGPPVQEIMDQPEAKFKRGGQNTSSYEVPRSSDWHTKSEPATHLKGYRVLSSRR